jgi:hypothetical protein
LFYFEIEETPCNFILFSHLVGGTKPQLSFVEFVMTMWNFLTIPQEDVALFLLTVCCINKSLHSDPKAILHLIHLIHFCENDLKDRLDEVRSFSTIMGDPCSIQIYSRQRKQTISVDDVNEDNMKQLIGMLTSPFMNLQNRLWKKILGVKNWMHLCEERKTLGEEYRYGYNFEFLTNVLLSLLGLNTRALSRLKSVEILHDTLTCTENEYDLHRDDEYTNDDIASDIIPCSNLNTTIIYEDSENSANSMY